MPTRLKIKRSDKENITGGGHTLHDGELLVTRNVTLDSGILEGAYGHQHGLTVPDRTLYVGDGTNAEGVLLSGPGGGETISALLDQLSHRSRDTGSIGNGKEFISGRVRFYNRFGWCSSMFPFPGLGKVQSGKSVILANGVRHNVFLASENQVPDNNTGNGMYGHCFADISVHAMTESVDCYPRLWISELSSVKPSQLSEEILDGLVENDPNLNGQLYNNSEDLIYVGSLYIKNGFTNNGINIDYTESGLWNWTSAIGWADHDAEVGSGNEKSWITYSVSHPLDNWKDFGKYGTTKFQPDSVNLAPYNSYYPYITDARYVDVAFSDFVRSDTFSMGTNDYNVILTTNGFKGSGFQLGSMYVSNKTQSGFRIECTSLVDNMIIDFIAIKTNIVTNITDTAWSGKGDVYGDYIS